MVKRTMSRVLATVLALFLLLSAFPVNAFAATEENPDTWQVDGLNQFGTTTVGSTVTVRMTYVPVDQSSGQPKIVTYDLGSGVEKVGDFKFIEPANDDPWWTIELDVKVTTEGTKLLRFRIADGNSTTAFFDYAASFVVNDGSSAVVGFSQISTTEGYQTQLYLGESTQFVVYYMLDMQEVETPVSTADETQYLSTLTWTSSNPSLISIDSKGVAYVNKISDSEKVTISVNGTDMNGNKLDTKSMEVWASEHSDDDDTSSSADSYKLTLDAGQGVFVINGVSSRTHDVTVTKNAAGLFVYDLMTYIPVLKNADGSEHAFLVWKDASGREVTGSNGLLTLSGDVTLYAEYEMDSEYEYSVRFNANGGYFPDGGTTATTADVTFNTSTYNVYDFTDEPVRQGYTFVGWYDGTGSTAKNMSNETLSFTSPGTYVLYAHWEKDDSAGYTATWIARFDADKQDVVLKTVEFESDHVISVNDYPIVPSYEGYVLDTWVDPVKDANGNVTIVAQHKKAEGAWTVIWMNGYTVGTAGKLTELKTDIISPLPAYPGTLPVRAGYKFVEWGEAVIDETNKTITIMAQWEKAADTVYKVTHRYLYNGNVIGTVEVVKAGTAGETITAASQTKQVRYRGRSYNFDRASVESIVVSSETVQEIILVYNYKVPVVTVTPGGGGGTGGDGTGGSSAFDERYIPMSKLNQTDHMAFVNGYGNGLMQPEAPITRAEAAQIFYNVLSSTEQKAGLSSTSKFSDVAENAWYSKAVIVLTNLKIIEGYPDGTFRPFSNITNAEFVTMAVRFLETAVTSGEGFPDTKGSWAETQIKTAQGAGWISGYADGLFHPEALITRAEVVSIVNKMLGRGNLLDDGMLSGMKTWNDVSKDKWYYNDIQEASNSHTYTLDDDDYWETWSALKN